MSKWSPIPVRDEYGLVAMFHVMPVDEAPTFASSKEARDFDRRLLVAGNPCIVDENGRVTHTYFGHALSKNCACEPDVDPSCPTLTYVHKLTQ